ncbi:MAG TPA: mechanosensitive ion channel family protein [Micromonosporaceae bacterium]|nr:mechanosensitive ion channel family protein [Micromonosporaceae bacterium]
MSPVVLFPSGIPLLAPTPTPVPTPVPATGSSPDCLHASDLCRFVYDHTGIRWLASSSYYVLVKPFDILLIIVIALIVRHLLRKAINKLVGRTSRGEGPVALRPLRLRLGEMTFSERRQQRSEAIGSVLTSFATAAVFSIAFLMILAEIGIQLAPLLASAGIAGLALGFGAQTLVKDVIAGLFMLLEDQYGVGDVVDLGEASGTVESVGLRTTSVRDLRGVLWHVRNGEIIRVGNRSQGWGQVVLDIPIGFAKVEDATQVLTEASAAMAEDPLWRESMISAPEVLGVEQLTVDGATLRVTVRTTADSQPLVARELRSRLTEALASAGITGAMSAGRVYIRRPTEGGAGGDTPGAGTVGPPS